MVSSFRSPICLLSPGWLHQQDWWWTVKIILHRIISVVWLTNFPSEIRRLTIPRWWARASFSWAWKGAGPSLELATARWWSLVAALCIDKGKDVGWVASCVLKWGQSWPLYKIKRRQWESVYVCWKTSCTMRLETRFICFILSNSVVSTECYDIKEEWRWANTFQICCAVASRLF